MPDRVPVHRPAHLPVRRDLFRKTAHRRGYNRRWRRAAKLFLARPENRLCVECRRVGRTELATVVDHKRPHRGDWELFWDESNWQGLCETHHNRKTGLGS
jgi:5-methylcytosine-specific restriction protein A